MLIVVAKFVAEISFRALDADDRRRLLLKLIKSSVEEYVQRYV